jgi:hypothetical protein
MRLSIPLFLLTLLFLLSRPAAATVFINEFDRGGTPDTVEIFNGGMSAQDLTGWYLLNSAGDTLFLSGTIPPDSFATSTQGDFVAESGQIELLDSTDSLMDAVPYGDQGGAPLPPPGYSCARHTDGNKTNNDADDWTLDKTATFGAPNDPPVPELGTVSVVMSEIGRATGPNPLRAGSCSFTPQIELFNRCLFDVNVTNWFLTDGRDIQVLSGTVPADSFLVFTFPTNFCFEETRVIYMFDHLDRRIDQWGIAGSSIVDETESWQRVPNGAGPFDGYDFPSSGGGLSMGIFPETFGGTNPPGVVSVSEGTLPTTWGRIKNFYR